MQVAKRKTTHEMNLCSKLANHYSRAENWVDMTGIILNLNCLTLVWVEYDMFKIRICASASTAVLWLQMYFWFRISSGLAFYVGLINATISEIQNFVVVLASLMLLFGSGMYML